MASSSTASTTEDLPDFICGIDFGQAFTGVVWTNLLNMNPTQSIRDWPGLPPDSVETKVPTKIAYPRNGDEPRWGFLCDSDDEYHEVADVREHFKIYLDQGALDAAYNNGVRDMPETVAEAMGLITDYLRQIYQHVKFSLESATGSWKDKKVEFVFSLPTTWNSLDTPNKFNEAIRAAGFTAENPEKHSAKLELTEAEAAAVYMATNPQVELVKGDIILICDAGGGTTDLGLIEILDGNAEAPALKQVAAVKGVGIGSTMIDRAFELLVQRRLDEHPDANLPDDLAHKLARGASFQSIKHNFGTRAATQTSYKIPLDRLGLGISHELSYPELGIEAGKIGFSKLEIQALFDIQIRGIIKQIEKQLDWMKTNRPNDHVRTLVLSGGLGGSQYVKTEIHTHYLANRPSNGRNMLILKSHEPRLAVVKGLVIDRRQKLISGAATLKTRVARASYGVLCREPYDPAVHIGAKTDPDPFNKKLKWALMQVDWLIKKGDTIDSDSSIEKLFSRRLVPGDQNRKFDTTILISHEDRDKLPRSFNGPGVYKLCTLQSDLKEVLEDEFEMRNKRPWQGKKYYLANFAVRMIIAPADLKFELWFKGKRYNRGHDPLSIEWDQAGATRRPSSSDGSRTPAEMGGKVTRQSACDPLERELYSDEDIRVKI